MTRRTATVLRLAVSLGLLGVLLTQVDADAVTARLAALDARWLPPILALTVLQVIASASGWHYRWAPPSANTTWRPSPTRSCPAASSVTSAAPVGMP